MKASSLTYRDKSIDLMKGIGIILMIIGHFGTIWPNVTNVASRIIYSFHMPMFFVIAGYWFKKRDLKECVLHSAKRLLIPYGIAMSALWIIFFLRSHCDLKNLALNILSAVMGYPFGQEIMGVHFQQILSLWFLLALFLAQIFFNLIMNSIKNQLKIGIVCLICGIVGLYIYKEEIPCCICQALSALPFMFFGYFYHQNHILFNKKPLIICLIFWVFGIIFSQINMVECSYRFYPFDMLTSLAGIYCFYHFCKYVCKRNLNLVRGISYIGEKSLIVLCVHSVDILSHFQWNPFVEYPITRMVLTIIIALIISFSLDVIRRKRIYNLNH